MCAGVHFVSSFFLLFLYCGKKATLRKILISTLEPFELGIGKYGVICRKTRETFYVWRVAPISYGCVNKNRLFFVAVHVTSAISYSIHQLCVFFCFSIICGTLHLSCCLFESISHHNSVLQFKSCFFLIRCTIIIVLFHNTYFVYKKYNTH